MSIVGSVIVGRTLAGGDTPILARLRFAVAGTPLVTQAALTSINYSVEDLTAQTQVTTGTLAIGTVIFNTLQTDTLWTQDSAAVPGSDGATGYNFLWNVPGAQLTYTPTFDPVTGKPVPHLFQCDAKLLATSGQIGKVAAQIYGVPVFV